jgi:hypothetical protein
MGDKVGKPVTRGGQQGHIVKVAASERFVPSTYPGKDPRTKAAHKGER